tara:strand:- start:727 stop:1545 length:819 start_codon:yes stop_codon:yes gene_type:complete
MGIQQLKSSKILVIGDTCIDVYHFGICNRISPEAPVPVFQSLRKESKNGMASNVADNLSGLGNDVDVIVNKQTIKKHRYVDEKTKQHLLRVDEGDAEKINELSDKEIEGLDFSNYDAVVISDYDKGFLSLRATEKLLNKVYNHDWDMPVFIDTKKSSLSIFEAHSNCIIKINELEYDQLESPACLTCDLIVTKGSNGATWVTENKDYEVEQTEVFDVCGAGDTFLAGLVTGYLSYNQDMDKAIRFANMCATYSVKKLGTYAIKKEDLDDLCV